MRGALLESRFYDQREHYQENAFENVVYKMSAILFRLPCVNV